MESRVTDSSDQKRPLKLLRRRALTLVEILVVVLILGVMLAIGISRMGASIAYTKTKSCEANMTAIFQAEETQRTKTRAYTSDLSTSSPLVPLMGAIPTCPVGPSAYTVTVTGTGAAQTIVVRCPNSGAHITGQTYSTANGTTFQSP